MATFEAAIPTVLVHEGGFADDPVDPGGVTNWGISFRWLASLGDSDGDGFRDGDIDRDGDVDADDVRHLTREGAAQLYRARFWDANGYGAIAAQGVATKLLDMAVNMGPKQAHLLLQRALAGAGQVVDVDGRFGPKTLAAVNAADQAGLLAWLRAACSGFYGNLIRKNPKLAKYAKGWERRAQS